MLIRRTKKRKGNVIVVLAFCLIAIMSVVAIAVDGGLLQDNRRHVQATADAAAMAAATDLFKHYLTENGLDLTGSADASARAVVADNGYDTSSSTVTVNIPPLSGDHLLQPGYAEVIVEYRQPSFFSSIFGQRQIPIRGRAVARGLWVKENNGIILLDPHAKAALNAHGNGYVNVTGANVLVNSDDPDAGTGSGGAYLQANAFNVTGGVNSYTPFNGTVNTGVAPTPDPLRFLPPPNINTLTVRSTRPLQLTSGINYLYPGVYQGGINATSSAALYLAPGIYYMDGGGFNFAAAGNLTGYNVMIYNAPQKNSDTVSIAGQGLVTMTAMDTGVYKGMLVYQSRTSAVPVSITGNGSFNVRGTFYAANAQMNVSGNGDTSLGAQYITRTMDIGGNGNVNITWDSSTTQPVRKIGLVE